LRADGLIRSSVVGTEQRRDDGAMTDGWTLAAESRIAFADLCDTLTAEQAEQPTWCDGWTSRLVAAHVATFLEVPLPKFMFTIMKHRGDFDAASWPARSPNDP